MSDGLFSDIEARGFVSDAVSDAALVRAMLRFETALAAAEGDAGVIPAAHAAAIADACRVAPDPAGLGRGAGASGAPVVPLLEAVRSRLDEDVAGSLHLGATTQDAVDSAAMLVTAGALRLVLDDLRVASDRAATLAADHRLTPALGRTLLQPAKPFTFGARAVTWMASIDAAMEGLARVRSDRLALQLGGPVGTLHELGDDADAVAAGVARRLSLPAPLPAWHAERSRVADLAGALGMAASAIEAVAVDLVLLAQAEVGEVVDGRPSRGMSSSMEHKRNPISAILARAAAMQAPGLVATLLMAAGSGELERAAGAWHAEWRAQRELLRSVGTAASWLRDALDHLEPRPDRMLQNLAKAGVGGPGDGVAAGERSIDAALAARPLPRAGAPTRLTWRADGPADASTLVLAGSLGSTMAMWDPLVPLLRTDFRVVRCDLRGHGDSPSPPAPYVIDDLGDDLVTLLDELGVRRAHLVGTSIGGMAALSAAARHGERIDRLVVIGASARFTDARPWVERARRVLVEGPEAVAEPVVARWTTPAWAADHADRRAGMEAMFRRADPAGYAGCCLALAAMDLRPSLGEIRAPTLVICGREDAATPPEHSEVIARGIAGAQLVLLDAAAHLPSIERPDRVAELVASHLRAGEPAASSRLEEIR